MGNCFHCAADCISEPPTKVHFINKTGKTIELYQIRADGDEIKTNKVVKPGGELMCKSNGSDWTFKCTVGDPLNVAGNGARVVYPKDGLFQVVLEPLYAA
ncbi:hypothetical protein BSKO_03870 [Bryopsis sp. KO-2023]|nr:hypothetical protein BSKO_03870 [Bryopsis sp. KO-2023]